MKRRVALCLMLATLAAPGQAGGPIAWGGVGWYLKVQDSYQGARPYAISGPFRDQASCDAEILRSRESLSKQGYSSREMWCNYETVAWATPVYDDDEDW